VLLPIVDSMEIFLANIVLNYEGKYVFDLSFLCK
jgi:hypothetical protein